MSRIKKNTLISISLLSFLVFSFLFFGSKTKAQTLSLSIAPPIYEISIVPGHEVELRYLLTNDAIDTNVQISLSAFTAGDDLGNVSLQNDLSVSDPYNIYSWFKIVKPDSDFKEKIPVRAGEQKDIIIKVSPPENASFGDYYITLLFSTSSEGLLAGNATISNARIGSNILLSVGDGSLIVKRAEIENFSVPLFIDSFSDINFNIKVKNIGNTFFKPTGNITIKPLLGKSKTLRLTPLNVLANSSRKIECSEGERIVPCSLRSNFFLGLYRSKLEFKTDNQGQIYTSQSLTFAFPFVLSFLLLVFYLVMKIVMRKFSNKKQI